MPAALNPPPPTPPQPRKLSVNITTSHSNRTTESSGHFQQTTKARKSFVHLSAWPPQGPIVLCYWCWVEFLSLHESAEHLWDYKNVSRTSIDITVGRLFHFKSRKGTKMFYIRCFFFLSGTHCGQNWRKSFTGKLSITGLPLCGTRLEHG